MLRLGGNHGAAERRNGVESEEMSSNSKSLIRDDSSTSSPSPSRVRANPRKKLPNCSEISQDLEREVTEQKDSHYRLSLARQMDTKFHLSQSAMTLSRFQIRVATNETLTQTRAN